MTNFEEAQRAKLALERLIDERIKENENVKSAIKARKAVITTSAGDENAPEGKVGVTLIGDTTELFLSYNSSFSIGELEKGNVVSVWYNYSLNNGIVMQNANWTK